MAMKVLTKIAVHRMRMRACVCVWCTVELSCYIWEDMKLELLTPNRKQWNSDGFKHVIKFGGIWPACEWLFLMFKVKPSNSLFSLFWGLLAVLRGGMFWTERWQPRHRSLLRLASFLVEDALLSPPPPFLSLALLTLKLQITLKRRKTGRSMNKNWRHLS